MVTSQHKPWFCYVVIILLHSYYDVISWRRLQSVNNKNGLAEIYFNVENHVENHGRIQDGGLYFPPSTLKSPLKG